MRELLVPVIGFVALIGAVTVSVIVVRLATALIKRLETVRPGGFPPDPSPEELRQELDAMQERIDFVERALLTQNQGGRELPAGKKQP
jgi:hypothetical protein